MFDVMKIGGVTAWLGAAALAESRALPVSSHLWPEPSAQLLSVTPTAKWLEYADWWNMILSSPLQIADGRAIPQSAPGSAVDWSEDGIGRCLS